VPGVHAKRDEVFATVAIPRRGGHVRVPCRGDFLGRAGGAGHGFANAGCYDFGLDHGARLEQVVLYVCHILICPFVPVGSSGLVAWRFALLRGEY
jgi:hypothetical protein